MNKDNLYVIADVLEFCVCVFLLIKIIVFGPMLCHWQAIDICKRIERAINKSNK